MLTLSESEYRTQDECTVVQMSRHDQPPPELDLALCGIQDFNIPTYESEVELTFRACPPGENFCHDGLSYDEFFNILWSYNCFFFFFLVKP